MCNRIVIEAILNQVRKDKTSMETVIYVIVSHLNITEEEAKQEIEKIQQAVVAA